MADGTPVAPAVAACPTRRSTADLSRALDQAEAAFERRDKATVISSATDAEAHILCLGEALTPSVAARFHRVQGLRAFLSQDQPAAGRSFAAAKAIEPAYVLPATLVPDAHPARVLYDSAPVGITASEPIPATRGSVRVDGRDLPTRPTDRPVVLQRFDESGAVAQTWVLKPADPLPELPAPLILTPTISANDRLPPPTGPGPTSRGPNKPLLFGAIGGVVVAGGLYGVSGAVKGQYDGLDRVPANEEQFQSLYGTNHGLIIGSAATLGLAVLAGAASFAVQW